MKNNTESRATILANSSHFLGVSYAPYDLLLLVLPNAYPTLRNETLARFGLIIARLGLEHKTYQLPSDCSIT